MQLGLGLGLGFANNSRSLELNGDDLPRKYLFIDGGFFQSFISETKNRIEPELQAGELEFSKIGNGYDRIFFYDAYPEKKTNQSQLEFEQTRKNTEQYFMEISRSRNFSVRPALTKGGRRQQQKGVDILLAIECLSHAMRNNIDEVTIMTSDLDFYPLFEALLQTKTKSVLRYQFGKTSSDLIAAADYSQPLTVQDYTSWLTLKDMSILHGIGVNAEEVSQSQKLDEGTILGKKIELFIGSKNGEKFYAALIDGHLMGNIRKTRSLLEGTVESNYGAQIKFASSENRK